MLILTSCSQPLKKEFDSTKVNGKTITFISHDNGLKDTYILFDNNTHVVIHGYKYNTEFYLNDKQIKSLKPLLNKKVERFTDDNGTMVFNLSDSSVFKIKQYKYKLRIRIR